VPRNLPPKKRSASPRSHAHAGAAASATLSSTAVVDAPDIVAPDVVPPAVLPAIAPVDPDQTTDLRRLTPPEPEPTVEPTVDPTTVVPVTAEPVPQPAVADDTEALMRRDVQPARPLRMVQVRARPRVRRVTRIVRHVDPWSVFKVALVFSAFLYGVCLTAGVLLWRVASDTGTIDNIENFFEETGWETFELKGGQIYHQAWIAGLFAAVGLVGFAVLVATLFNLVTDLVGGVRVSVLEEEVVARGERPLRRKDLRTMRRQARKMQRPAPPTTEQPAAEVTETAVEVTDSAADASVEAASEPAVELPSEPVSDPFHEPLSSTASTAAAISSRHPATTTSAIPLGIIRKASLAMSEKTGHVLNQRFAHSLSEWVQSLWSSELL